MNPASHNVQCQRPTTTANKKWKTYANVLKKSWSPYTKIWDTNRQHPNHLFIKTRKTINSIQLTKNNLTAAG